MNQQKTVYIDQYEVTYNVLSKHFHVWDSEDKQEQIFTTMQQAVDYLSKYAHIHPQDIQAIEALTL